MQKALNIAQNEVAHAAESIFILLRAVICMFAHVSLVEAVTNCVAIVRLSATHGGLLVCILLISPPRRASLCAPTSRCARVTPSRDVPGLCRLI